MTYVPVPADRRKSTAGRTPNDIPDALLAQLRHSRATGAKCEIELTPDDKPEDVAELRRALVRAGYRHFSENTIYKRFKADRVIYWVGPKKAKGTKQNGDD